MSSTAAKFKKAYTWDDYRTWPDDERWEVIGGEAYSMSPSPTVRHQIVQMNIWSGLKTFLRGQECRAFTAPLDVKLSEMDIVQPDVLVVCKPGQIKSTHIEGAPALVVEILSDSSERHDRGTKMRLYAAHGVSEVWLVKPFPSMVEVYSLDGESYRLAAAYVQTDTLKSPGFPKLKMKLRDVFDFPLEPDEKKAMAVRESRPKYAAKMGR